ncbi:S8 family peptidase [Parahaliea mediterranea]|uniref:S8 family peptidase n=1 Tax=Parahaliea mediterranea TaxID=651086 RepID=A0A939IKU1_9GAMM|nr:S8 family peptidase [Parahaliea mediterranea]MBN7799139.1 S8 family peptidase [Parahaliea mediterranea]
MPQAQLLPSLLLPLLLAACGGGGGGGGGGNNPPPANSPPLARATAPERASPGDTVILDGGDSTDRDGSIASWAWEQAAGPTVTLSGAEGPEASFTAPQVNTLTELSFVLTVTDDDGAEASAQVALRVAPPAGAARFSISGTVLAPAFQDVDGDTNDPANAPVDNNSVDTAQRIGNPVTLGGYVNQPGSGAEGQSSTGGDEDDFFVADLLAGQTVTLLVAEPAEGDADLYLGDLAGNVLDFSVETGDFEQVVAPEDGRYTINVFAFDGATNYILAIGNPVAGNPVAGIPVAGAALPQRPPLVAGEAIVSYEPDSPASQLAELAPDDLAWHMGMRQRGGGPGRARLLATLEAGIERARLGAAAGRGERIADLELRARWETLIQIKRLRNSPGVRDASPNYRLRPLFTPDDPALGYQWHYPLIDLPAAWDVSTGSSEVVVAVIDTGILADHPDIRGQLVPGYDFIRDPQVAGDGDGIDPDPEDTGNTQEAGASSYHGTHVGGTVAAAGNNGTGVAGVAYGARLMPLRAISDEGGTSYDVAQAVRYAAGLANDSGRLPERPADIINLSLGGEGFSNITQALYREVRAAGVIVVAAAGNEASSQPGYPASYEGVISVSAVDAQRRATSYSNRGAFIDVAAPGGDGSRDIAGDGYPDGVLSTGASGAGASLDYAYTFVSGTSMAAPHVSGVIALMKSINPDLGPAAVDELLARGELTADLGSPGRDDLYGHGLIDARRAVNAALASRGDSVQTEARLSASSGSLNFGSERDSLELVLASGGSSPVRVQQLAVSQPWLNVSASDIDANGLGRYTLVVDRGGLADGIYSATLTVQSSANTLQVQVQMAVGDSAGSNLGTLYILLFHPDTGSVVEQFVGRAEDGRYHYRFDNVIAGSYRLFAGTDADNDLLICDPGEACGAWLTTDRPATLQLDSDRDGVDFPADYLVSIPVSQGVDAAPAQLPELSRRQ